jgi:hypothetical protein
MSDNGYYVKYIETPAEKAAEDKSWNMPDIERVN